jgi:hypothetical protein
LGLKLCQTKVHPRSENETFQMSPAVHIKLPIVYM